jgi:hypothetical protein
LRETVAEHSLSRILRRSAPLAREVRADRDLDESIQSRDLIDLAFLAAHYGARPLQPGLLLAKSAHGSAVRHYFDQGLVRFGADSRTASRNARSLGIDDPCHVTQGDFDSAETRLEAAVILHTATVSNVRDQSGWPR